MILSELPLYRSIRPHTKSRLGCLNCKSRRVKCQETRPRPCQNCIRRRVECVYASNSQTGRRRNTSGESYCREQRLISSKPNIALAKAPQDSSSSLLKLQLLSSMSPESFTGEDLRFFHHFLLTAYPHLPFQSENLWKTSLPASAHQCPHLMHAILCLGASHLSLISPSSDSYTAMAAEHRGKALKYLSSALASPNHPNRTELDLILATTYALTFQASYMTDGLIDFAVMVRGCSTITRYILAQYQSSEMFKLLMPNDIYAHVLPLLSAEPCHSPEMIDACIETLEAIQPLLQGDIPRHLTYNAILSTYQAMKVSAQQAFLMFTFIYSSWDHMNDREFIEFLDPGDPVSGLLLIHFIAATIMMRPIFETLRVDIVHAPKDALANHHWGIHRYESLPAKFRGLVEWQYSFITADKARIESGAKITCNGQQGKYVEFGRL